MVYKSKGRRRRFDYEDLMREECVRAFWAAWEVAPAGSTVIKIAKLAVKLPARRLWVSETHACEMMRKIDREGLDCLANMLTTKRRMYEYMYRRVQELRKRGVPRKAAVYQVCGSPAPEFFLTPGTLLVLRSRKKRKG